MQAGQNILLDGKFTEQDIGLEGSYNSPARNLVGLKFGYILTVKY
jgi:hypothetical protein